jgi:hypothetical protein
VKNINWVKIGLWAAAVVLLAPILIRALEIAVEIIAIAIRFAFGAAVVALILWLAWKAFGPKVSQS